MCSGYKLDRTGDTVHPEGTAGACYHSCCDTGLDAGGDSACWYGSVTFEACCLQVSASGTTSAGSSHGGSSYTYGGSSYTHGGSSYTHGGSSYVQHTSGSMHQQSYNHYETTAAAVAATTTASQAPTTTTAGAVASTTTAVSLPTYKDADPTCWGGGFFAMCSGYKLDRTGDTVHPEGTAGACYHSCCDTGLDAGGDSACWYGSVTFEACCSQVSASGTR